MGALSTWNLKWHPVAWRVLSNGHVLHSLSIWRRISCSKSIGADGTCSQVLFGVSSLIAALCRRLRRWTGLLISCAKVTTTAKERTATIATSTPAMGPFKIGPFADDITEETQNKLRYCRKRDTHWSTCILRRRLCSNCVLRFRGISCRVYFRNRKSSLIYPYKSSQIQYPLTIWPTQTLITPPTQPRPIYKKVAQIHPSAPWTTLPQTPQHRHLNTQKPKTTSRLQKDSNPPPRKSKR